MAGGAGAADLTFIQDIPLEVVVELGRTKLTVGELAELKRDDVLELDRAASEPLELRVGGRLFARGELTVVEDQFAIRIVEVVGQQGEDGERK